MRKLVVSLSLIAFVAATTASCISGHKSQSWHPKTGKKPKSGHNR